MPGIADVITDALTRIGLSSDAIKEILPDLDAGFELKTWARLKGGKEESGAEVMKDG